MVFIFLYMVYFLKLSGMGSLLYLSHPQENILHKCLKWMWNITFSKMRYCKFFLDFSLYKFISFNFHIILLINTFIISRYTIYNHTLSIDLQKEPKYDSWLEIFLPYNNMTFLIRVSKCSRKFLHETNLVRSQNTMRGNSYNSNLTFH